MNVNKKAFILFGVYSMLGCGLYVFCNTNKPVLYAHKDLDLVGNLIIDYANLAKVLQFSKNDDIPSKIDEIAQLEANFDFISSKLSSKERDFARVSLNFKSVASQYIEALKCLLMNNISASQVAFSRAKAQLRLCYDELCGTIMNFANQKTFSEDDKNIVRSRLMEVAKNEIELYLQVQEDHGFEEANKLKMYGGEWPTILMYTMLN